MRKKIRLIISMVMTISMLLSIGYTSTAAGNAIWTTDTDGSVNVHYYVQKSDVYLNGGPQHGAGNLIDGKYDVVVFATNGQNVLGKSAGEPIVVEQGRFKYNYRLISKLVGNTFLSSSNDQYKVEIGKWGWDNRKKDWVWLKYKSDNFTVGGNNKITINKLIEGAAGDNQEFSIKLTGPLGNNSEVTYHTVTAGTPLVISGVLKGKYIIEETDIPFGYALKSVSPAFVEIKNNKPTATFTVTNIKHVPGILIEKTVDKLTAYPDEEVTYTLKVTNTGNVALTDATVTDPLLGSGWSWNVGNIAAGATLSKTETFSQSAIGGVENTAAVTAKFGQQTLTSTASAFYTVIEIPVTDISLTKSVDKATVYPGEQVTYTFIVKNTGNVDLTDVVVTDNMLGAEWSWSIGDLARDAEATTTAGFSTDTIGTVINTATVVGNYVGGSLTRNATATYEVIESPSPTAPPESPSPTAPPESPSPTAPPESPSPTAPPESPSPTAPPESPSPTAPPESPSPTAPPESPSPTAPPESPSPTVPPESPSPTAPPVPEQVTLTTGVIGQGTVLPGPGATIYNKGTQVQLNPQPAEGWEFIGWQGDPVDSNNQIYMESNKSATAVFREIIIPDEAPPAAPAVMPAVSPDAMPETELVTVAEEEVPAAPVLPKTGGIPAEAAYGFGSLLAAAGIFLKKKLK